MNNSIKTCKTREEAAELIKGFDGDEWTCGTVDQECGCVASRIGNRDVYHRASSRPRATLLRAREHSGDDDEDPEFLTAMQQHGDRHPTTAKKKAKATKFKSAGGGHWYSTALKIRFREDLKEDETARKQVCRVRLLSSASPPLCCASTSVQLTSGCRAW